jgi:hypothetical protein
MHNLVKQVISGGQTGADQVGLLAAKKHGIPTGGIACRGYMTVDGAMEELLYGYGLVDLNMGYSARTKANAINADCTIIFASNSVSSGTKLTIQTLKKNNKPFLIVPIPDSLDAWIPEPYLKQALDMIRKINHPVVLNIAGNSTLTGNHTLVPLTEIFLSSLFSITNKHSVTHAPF